MVLIRFPDPRQAAFEGIVAIGGSLNTINLLNAYRQGIFPWPIEGWPLPWFCPDERAILAFEDLHVPRSLARVSRRAPFRFTIDRDFSAVMTACARAKRTGEDGTWITPERSAPIARPRKDMPTASSLGDERLVAGLRRRCGGLRGREHVFSAPNASKSRCFTYRHIRERGSTG